MQQTLLRSDISEVIAITRKPLSSPDPRLHNVTIPDFGNLDAISDSTWLQISGADALVWAMGSYTFDDDVNLKFPLAFQEALARRMGAREGKSRPFRFILLGGAFTETNQSRWLYFLGGQRRMKGLLETQTLQFAEAISSNVNWHAHIIKPAGVLMGGDTYTNGTAEYMFGLDFVIRGEELGAFVADLAVRGNEKRVIENKEMVETGRRLRDETLQAGGRIDRGSR